MVKRKVFIVKGFSKNEQELIDDEYFVEAYSTFFQLNAGGAYTAREIICFSEPSLKLLEKSFRRNRLDFGIIVFIGHGGNKLGNQVFQLNSEEIIKPGQLTLRSKKQIIILESCRDIVDEISTVDLKDKIPMFEKGGIVRFPLTNKQSREVYDSHVKRCADGLMICYACKAGESAYNFLFSKAILQCSMDWHMDSSRHCAILPIDELSRLVWVDTLLTAKEKYGVIQMPHTEGDMNFPFAVSKF